MLYFFILLIAGHIFGDYILQLNRLAQYKRKSLLVLGLHALSWALVISLVLYLADFFALWKLIFLSISHFLIDGLKIRLFPVSLPMLHPVNVGDQSLHLLTILLTVCF